MIPFMIKFNPKKVIGIAIANANTNEGMNVERNIRDISFVLYPITFKVEMNFVLSAIIIVAINRTNDSVINSVIA